MAKKEPRISINKLESTLKENIVKIPLEGAEDVEIVIRRNLSLKDALQFTKDVVESCLDSRTGEFTPEIKQFAINASILTKYANFTLPSNVEKQYELIYNTDALSQVMPYINQVQLNEITTGIDDVLFHKATILQNATTMKVNELLTAVEGVTAQLAGLFEGIEGADLGKFMSNISNMESVSEADLAKAVLDIQRDALEEEDTISVQKQEE